MIQGRTGWVEIIEKCYASRVEMYAGYNLTRPTLFVIPN